MGRKVFISFLGTNNYKPCVYKSDELGESSVVIYVQDAILQLISKKWTSNDKVYVFLTQGARNKHWDTLIQSLTKYHYAFEIIPISPIAEGYSEDEIWNVFLSVYNVLEERDDITLDITHGFRSLPMLSMVLLQYAKVLKKITVSNVLYGAFEALGEAYKIDEKYPNPSDRKAPLLNLTAFAQLQEWTTATSDFIDFGNAQKLIKTLKYSDFSSSANSKNANKKIKTELTDFAKNLQVLMEMFTTNRGQAIIDAEIPHILKKSVDTIAEFSTQIPKLNPLNELLNKIQDRVKDYQLDDVFNGILAVEWCLNSDLIQQGITLLQEFIITICLHQSHLDYQNKSNRNTTSALLGKDPREPFTYSENDTEKNEQMSLVNKLNELPYIIDIQEIYRDLGSEHRNDIQHAGFTRKTPKTGTDFLLCLKRNLNKVKEIHFIN